MSLRGNWISLSADKPCRCLDRLKIGDIQVVGPHFDGEGFLEESHQLDGEERVDDAALEEVVVVFQAGKIDGGEDERPDLGADFGVVGDVHAMRWEGFLSGGIDVESASGFAAEMAGVHEFAEQGTAAV